MQYLKYKSGKSRGQAIVEFALVLPVLLVLSMLIIQYGIIFYTTIGLTNLSREGARFAATQPASTVAATVATQDAAVRTRIQNVLPPSIKWADIQNNITITCLDTAGNDKDASGNPIPRAAGLLIKVTITYNMSNKLFLPSTFFGVRIFSTNYTTFTTMMIES